MSINYNYRFFQILVISKSLIFVNGYDFLRRRSKIADDVIDYSWLLFLRLFTISL